PPAPRSGNTSAAQSSVAAGRAFHGSPWPSARACRSHRVDQTSLVPAAVALLSKVMCFDSGSCDFLRGELRQDDFAVDLAALHQVAMRADIHHPALVEHENLVGVHDR